MQTITAVGLDIAKSVFQVHCVDANGQVVLRRQRRRRAEPRDELPPVASAIPPAGSSEAYPGQGCMGTVTSPLRHGMRGLSGWTGRTPRGDLSLALDGSTVQARFGGTYARVGSPWAHFRQRLVLRRNRLTAGAGGAAERAFSTILPRAPCLRLTAHRLAAWLTALRLSRDHSVRFPDGASFVASVFQALVGDLRPKLFQSLGCRLVRVAFGLIGGPRHR
jgi:hypothetical protein